MAMKQLVFMTFFLWLFDEWVIDESFTNIFFVIVAILNIFFRAKHCILLLVLNLVKRVGLF